MCSLRSWSLALSFRLPLSPTRSLAGWRSSMNFGFVKPHFFQHKLYCRQQHFFSFARSFFIPPLSQFVFPWQISIITKRSLSLECQINQNTLIIDLSHNWFVFVFFLRLLRILLFSFVLFGLIINKKKKKFVGDPSVCFFSSSFNETNPKLRSAILALGICVMESASTLTPKVNSFFFSWIHIFERYSERARRECERCMLRGQMCAAKVCCRPKLIAANRGVSN